MASWFMTGESSDGQRKVGITVPAIYGDPVAGGEVNC